MGLHGLPKFMAALDDIIGATIGKRRRKIYSSNKESVENRKKRIGFFCLQFVPPRLVNVPCKLQLLCTHYLAPFWVLEEEEKLPYMFCKFSRM